MSRRGPDFLGIGAVKAGTTWLHHNLARHPRVWMPPVKELRYFDEARYHPEPRRDLARRLLDPLLPHRLASPDRKRYEHWRRELAGFLATPDRWLGPRRLAWHLSYFFGRRDPAWYASLFPSARRREREGALLAGEITPLYALLDDAGVDAVARTFPELKVLYLLRDPVERTWSHVVLRCLSLAGWRWDRVTPELVHRTFFQRDVDDRRLWRHDRYDEILGRWQGRFGADRVGVFFHDDLAADPPALLARVHGFLGLEEDPGGAPGGTGGSGDTGPTVRRRHHATPVPLSPPPEIEAEIARRALPDLERLSRRFAGRHPAPARWLERARRKADPGRSQRGGS